MTSQRHRLYVMVVVVLVFSLLLSACGSNGNGNNSRGGGNGNGNSSNSNKIAICHKTGNPNKPYKMLTISKNALQDGHSTHAGDIIPAPANGCPNK